MSSDFHMILVHGYGVRAPFWDGFRSVVQEAGVSTEALSLKLEGVDSAIDELTGAVREAKGNGSVVLVGHSLGGILSALATTKLPAGKVSALVVISSPYGKRTRKLSPLMRFLIFRGLIPEALIRPTFFGPNIKQAVQKEIFSHVVKEAPEIQALINRETWFHTSVFGNESGGPIAEPALRSEMRLPRALFIASESDRIVPWKETQAFAAAFGGEFSLFPVSERIGHDDIAVGGAAAHRVWDLIRTFVGKS